MSLDVSKPSDTGDVVSSLAGYERETRVAVNSLEEAIATLGAISVQTTLVLSAGTTSIDITTDLSAVPIEVVNITGDGASDLASLTGGSKGQIKVFILGDTDIAFDNSSIKANGTFFLNQPEVATSFGNAENDIIAMVNVGGDGDTVSGYWQELYRNTSAR